MCKCLRKVRVLSGVDDPNRKFELKVNPKPDPNQTKKTSTRLELDKENFANPKSDPEGKKKLIIFNTIMEK